MNADADYRWIELNPDYRSRLQRFECAEQHDWLAPAGVDVVKKHGKYYYEYEWAFNSYLFSIFSYLIMIFSFRCMVYWNTWDY